MHFATNHPNAICLQSTHCEEGEFAVFRLAEELKQHNKIWHPNEKATHKEVQLRYNPEIYDIYTVERNNENRPEVSPRIPTPTPP